MIRVELSGTFRLTHDGQPHPLPYMKARALLAFLLLEPGWHSRDKLADLLWPDEPSDIARQNLRRMLTLLRKALGPAREALDADREQIMLLPSPYLRCDITDMQAPTLCQGSCTTGIRQACSVQARQTLAGFRGPLLTGLDTRQMPQFADWLERQRNDQLRQVLLRHAQLIHCLEQADDLDEAIRHARSACELDPLDEALHRQLMRLLVRHGQPEAALLQYDRCRQRLNQEMEVEPETGTRQLAEQIRQQIHALPPDMATDPDGEQRFPLAILCLQEHALDDPEEESGREERAIRQARHARLVRRHGGHIVDDMPAFTLAWFGFPSPLDHPAHAALHCALDLAAHGAAIGVEGGVCLCAPAEGEADLDGRLTRAAWRLADQAEAGQVLAGHAVAETASDAFRFKRESRGSYRVEGPLSRLNEDITFGRQQETGTLLAHWEAVSRRQGQAILLVADAGMGKTTLIHSLEQTIRNVLRLRCRREHAHTPFWPLMTLLQQLLDLDANSTDTRWITALTGQAPDLSVQECHHLIDLVRHEAQPGRNQGISPRPALLTAFRTLIAAHAGRAPCLMWIEDLHWSDPSSITLLEQLALAPPPGLMLVMTSRPPVITPAGCLRMDLEPLTDEPARALARHLAEGRLDESAISQILQRAEGVPFFIRELVRVCHDHPDQSLPSTLDELLLARLQALPEALPVAQLASVIGRRFTPSLLGAAGIPAARIRQQLGLLDHAGLIRHDPLNGEWAFTHALLQEAAYRSMSLAQRRNAHDRVARALIESGAYSPGIVARHFNLARRGIETLEHALAAAHAAMATHALNEAGHYLDLGLDALDRLLDIHLRDEWELRLRLLQGQILQARHGYGSQEARLAYEAAERLTGNNPQHFGLVFGLWLGSSSWSTHETSLRLAGKLAGLARLRPDDPYARCHAGFALGNGLYCHGRFAEAAAALEEGLASYPEDAGLSPYGEDPGITSLVFLAWSRWHLNQPDLLEQACERAQALASRLDQPHSRCYAWVCSAFAYRLKGDVEQVERLSGQALQLAMQHDLALWIAGARLLQGWALAARGNPEGITAIQGSVNDIRHIMAGIEILFLSTLADACERLAAWPAALETCQTGLAFGEMRQDRHYEAEFLRIQAVASRHLGLPDSQACLEAGSSLARAQGSLAILDRIEATRLETGRD